VDLVAETNFIVAYAKGQRSAYRSILDGAENGAIRLLVPEACLMEAIKWYEKAVRSYNAFSDSVNERIRELRRADDLEYARGQIATFESALLENERYKDDLRFRLLECCARLTACATLLPLSTRWLADPIAEKLIEADADDLILASIIDAVRSRTVEEYFLTENTSDFDTEGIRALLAAERVQLTKSPEQIAHLAGAR
jgi:predicted nucleic acid-binding protein